MDRQKVNGAYYWEKDLICIADYAPATTYAHEMGHWIYHKQVWSGELQDHAGQVFASSPLRTCTDENFAVGYAMYCTGQLGGELEQFYTVIEDGICRSF